MNLKDILREIIIENLRNWFKKEKWKRIDTQGNIAGEFTDGMPDQKEQDLIIRSAKLHDALFALEKNVLKTGGNELDIETAQIIADQIMAMARMMDLEDEHNYVQNHVKIISDTINKKK